MNIVAAMTDKNLFGLHFSAPSWTNWLAVLKGAFAPDSMTDPDRDIYQKATRRETTPAALHELWMLIGRRGGKDAIASFLALSLACSRDWKKELRPGETAVGMILCPDRRQGRVALGYMKGYLETIPLLNGMVEDIQKEAISFNNGIRVEIHTASFRSVRGYTVPFCILDELAFFRDETSANPDTEILAALRPAMSTVKGSMLICISTPYSRRGELWKAHERYFGREDDSVLVIEGPTQFFNPTVPARVIADAFEADAVSAASEYGSPEEGIQFRSDVEAFVSREAVEACVVQSLIELPFNSQFGYIAFADPSGGSSDSFTLAIAHRENGRAVLDVVRERKPPFSPEGATKEYADLLKSYRLAEVSGDRYAGEWPREQFRKNGIEYRTSDHTKSEIYLELLPTLNSGKIELLDNARLKTQLCSLERRTARSGRESIDHGPNGHDDLINAAAGALTKALGQGSQVFPELSDVHNLDNYGLSARMEFLKPLLKIAALNHTASGAVAFIELGIDAAENSFVLDEYYGRDHRISEHAQGIRSILDLYGKQEYTLINPNAEESELFSIQAAYSLEGVQTVQANRHSIDVGLNLIKERLLINPGLVNPFSTANGSPRLFISKSRCPNLWREISELQAGSEAGKTKYIGSDAAIDNLRCILMSRPKPPKVEAKPGPILMGVDQVIAEHHKAWVEKWMPESNGNSWF